jgi:dipeptidyl aminopeptidase/acylaminoacyl peptidase
MSDLIRAVRRLVCLAALVLAPVAAAAAEPPPLAAFGNLPDIENMALSNDGSRLAAVMTIGGERVVLLMTAELDTLRMMRIEQAKIRGLEWVGNDHVVVEVSHTEVLGPEFTPSQIEFFHAMILPADQSEPQQLVFDGTTMLNAVFGSYGVRNVDGRWKVYFSGVERERGARGYYIGSTAPDLFVIDVASNQHRRLADKGSQGYGYSWLLGTDGTLAAMMSIERRSGDWSLNVPGARVIASGTSKNGDVGLVSLGKDGTTAIYSELNETEHVTYWFEVPLDGSAAPTELMRSDEVDRRYNDRATGRLLGLLRTGSNQRPQFYDARQQAAVNRIYRAFADFQVDLMDWTPDFSRVLVRTSGHGDSGTWYLVDMAQMRASAVGYERKALGPESVGAVSTVSYKAGDGIDLDGILTVPPGLEARNLPLVVLPHGGPHAHDEAGFDWWAQAFASRGYAVFQPNFRGSTNRDEGFMRAGFGQWGKAMQTDISDGVADLARQGIIDPERVCIVGASYGGYAALAGVTVQQGLYKCAVAVAPVADLGSLFTDEGGTSNRSGMLRRSLLEELGPRSGFDAVSPRQLASRADSPILLIHGKDDTVVPFDQSDNMAHALAAAGKPYKLVILRQEDHWLSRPATRLQMLEEAVSFVEQHNPPG